MFCRRLGLGARGGSVLPGPPGWSCSRLLREGIGLMLRRFVVGLVGLVALALPAGASAEGGCANEQVRQQQGYALGLADCRGYELVTPVEKGDGSLPGPTPGALEGVGFGFEGSFPYGLLTAGFQASASGDGLA